MEYLNKYILAKKMSEDESSRGSVIEKFFRKPPIKFLLNVLIISLLIAYIMEVQQPENEFFFRDRLGIASILIEPEHKSGSALTQPLVTIDEFTDHLDALIEGYYSAPEVSSGLFSHYAVSRSEPIPKPPILTIQYREGNHGDVQIITSSYELTPEHHLGPFSDDTFLASFQQLCAPEAGVIGQRFVPCRNSSLADFADRLLTVKVSMTIRGVMTSGTVTTMPNVVKWDITTSYNFKAMNSILEADTSIDASISNKQRLRTLPITLVAVMIPAALWDICICLLFFIRYTAQDLAKLEYDSYTKSLYFVRRGWYIFALFGDIMIITFCAVALAAEFGATFSSNLIIWKALLLGFSSWFYSILFLSHFRKFPQIYLVADCLIVALPHLGLYLIGIFPILLGYTLCGTAMFGGMSELFKNFPSSMVALFSMLNGDSILDIFVSANQTELVFLKWFSFCLLALFVIIFILTIHNIALNIVQDSYNFVCDRQEIQNAVKAAEDQRSLGGNACIGEQDVRRAPAFNISELKSISTRLKVEIGSDDENGDDPNQLTCSH